jgi:hypothetical protein
METAGSSKSWLIQPLLQLRGEAGSSKTLVNTSNITAEDVGGRFLQKLVNTTTITAEGGGSIFLKNYA